MTEAFCVRCRKVREMKKEQRVMLSNGKKAKKGFCEECGTKMYRIVKGDDSFLSFLLSAVGLEEMMWKKEHHDED
ncbi:MAG: hypothetical protein KAS32_18050 [Candidatus Peribacteraceae bacterium]|nr:hypothetical protein [Candidatus Peribacteraceae bacterium]